MLVKFERMVREYHYEIWLAVSKVLSLWMYISWIHLKEKLGFKLLTSRLLITITWPIYTHYMPFPSDSRRLIPLLEMASGFLVRHAFATVYHELTPCYGGIDVISGGQVGLSEEIVS